MTHSHLDNTKFLNLASFLYEYIVILKNIEALFVCIISYSGNGFYILQLIPLTAAGATRYKMFQTLSRSIHFSAKSSIKPVYGYPLY